MSTAIWLLAQRASASASPVGSPKLLIAPSTRKTFRWKVWSTALWRSASGSGALGSAPALSRNSAVGFQEGRPFAATLIKPSRDWAREATVGESRLPHVCCKHVTAKVQATVCVHLLEKLQCLLRPCAKFQEPTASLLQEPLAGKSGHDAC